MDRTPTLIPLAFALAACGGGDVATLDLSLEMTSSSALRAAGITAVDADGAVVMLDGGQLHLSRIDLEMQDGGVCDPASVQAPVSCEPAEREADDDGDDGDTVRIAGPFLVDLATGTSEPSLEGLSVPAGVYEEIELRLSPDDALGGASVTAWGTVPDADGNAVPWSLALDLDEEAEFEAVGGIEIIDATSALVQLDAAVWFAQLPVSSCLDGGLLAEDGAGGVLLDDSAGCDIEEALEDAIEESGEVEDDDDTENETETETD